MQQDSAVGAEIDGMLAVVNFKLEETSRRNARCLTRGRKKPDRPAPEKRKSAIINLRLSLKLLDIMDMDILLGINRRIVTKIFHNLNKRMTPCINSGPA